MSFTHRIVAILTGLLLLALPALAQKLSPERQKSVDLVRKHVDSLGGKGAGELSLRTENGVAAVFPDHHMVIVRFRIFPVARVMPEGLNASNIFVVNKEGKIEHLKDNKTLEKFFRAHHVAVKNEKGAKQILSAWLALSQEFHQDGMFKFEILDKEFAVEGETPLKASGRLMVAQGGNGQLNAQLTYDKEGKLSAVAEKAAIRPGPRPICQATKLLDPDPVVRRIVEQDLLIMGLSSRDYLMEQRAQATPELRQAIDRVWEQIRKNGW